MGSSFCDPTREVCPFGAAIDPTQALVNNVFQGIGTAPPAVPGIPGPLKPQELPVPSIRNAPNAFIGNFPTQFTLPPINIPNITFGGGGTSGPVFQQGPTRTPPLLPGRIPPAPLAFPSQGGGCGGCAKCIPGGSPVNGCCPKGCHPDKKYGVKCVRNRRMNVANMKAAKRATRRLAGFDKMARAAKRELKKLCR